MTERDLHSRLQDIVDEHLGFRPTTPIDGLLTILETELGAALGPPMQTRCSACGEEVDSPHTWKDCFEVLHERIEQLEAPEHK